MLEDDQLQIFATVMAKLEEWMTTDDLTKFEPLRLIINGAGGSGKSVVLNTIITYMRKMYDSNGVVKVVAPTGTAAYNVGGETFHHLLNMRVSHKEYIADTLSPDKRKRLVKKFRIFLALIIDERSLADFVEIGTAQQMIAETIYNGGPLPNEDWGGLPILIFAGDDFQLPGCKEGSLSALECRARKKMAHKG